MKPKFLFIAFRVERVYDLDSTSFRKTLRGEALDL